MVKELKINFEQISRNVLRGDNLCEKIVKAASREK